MSEDMFLNHVLLSNTLTIVTSHLKVRQMQSILFHFIHRGVGFQNLISPNIFNLYQILGRCNNVVRVITAKVILASLSYFDKISIERVGTMTFSTDH